VYYNKLPGGEYIYLLLYVDDMLIVSKSRSAIDKLKKDLSSEFKMKDFGEAKNTRHGDWVRLKEWQGELDTKKVFTKGTSEVQH